MTNLLVEDFDPAIVPDKFKNTESGALKVDTLIGSYAELEKKLSSQSTAAAPSRPEDYCINCDHGLFEPDIETNTRLHAKGMSEEQVQEVYNLAAEKMVPMIQQMAGDFDADRELEKIIAHFGGTDQWKAISRQLLSFGKKNLPADVLDTLSSSYEGVLALYRMMGSSEPSLSKKSDGPAAADQMELQSMMRDPKYWREKDPAFISKVTKGFEKMYKG